MTIKYFIIYSLLTLPLTVLGTSTAKSNFNRTHLEKIVVYYLGWENNYMSMPSDGQIRSEATNVLTGYGKFGNLDFFLQEFNGLKCEGRAAADNDDVGSPAMLVDLYSQSKIVTTLVISKSAILVKQAKGGQAICGFDLEFIKSMLIPLPTS